MANPKGAGGFRPLNPDQLDTLVRAAANPNNVTYADIAKASGLKRSTVIRNASLYNLRPKGNFIESRSARRPSIDARYALREKLMRAFILQEAMRGNPVGVNQLMGRYGGTKVFAGGVLRKAESDLMAHGAMLKRLTVADQAHKKSKLISPPGIPLSKLRFRKR